MNGIMLNKSSYGDLFLIKDGCNDKIYNSRFFK